MFHKQIIMTDKKSRVVSNQLSVYMDRQHEGLVAVHNYSNIEIA